MLDRPYDHPTCQTIGYSLRAKTLQGFALINRGASPEWLLPLNCEASPQVEVHVPGECLVRHQLDLRMPERPADTLRMPQHALAEALSVMPGGDRKVLDPDVVGVEDRLDEGDELAVLSMAVATGFSKSTVVEAYDRLAAEAGKLPVGESGASEEIRTPRRPQCGSCSEAWAREPASARPVFQSGRPVLAGRGAPRRTYDRVRSARHCSL